MSGKTHCDICDATPAGNNDTFLVDVAGCQLRLVTCFYRLAGPNIDLCRTHARELLAAALAKLVDA